MGCDIHCYAEIKTNGKWEAVTNKFPYPYRQGEMCDEPYKGRNYALFGILADVRNGRGFGGCDIGDAVIPISFPKGMPKDISGYIKEKSDEWGEDGHSHSYFTLRELSEHNWDKLQIERGWVDRASYEKFKKDGLPPKSSCGGVSGRGIRNLTHEEMEAGAVEGKQDYTQISWGTPERGKCKNFLKDMETFEQMYPDMSTEDMRIVFWFDN